MSVTRYELHPYKGLMIENDEGEYIKYDDIMHLLSMQHGLIDDYSRQIYKLEAKIAEYEMVPKYLVTQEDVQNGYSIGAKDSFEQSRRPGVINGPSFVDQNALSLKERSE